MLTRCTIVLAVTIFWGLIALEKYVRVNLPATSLSLVCAVEIW